MRLLITVHFTVIVMTLHIVQIELLAYDRLRNYFMNSQH